MYLKVTIAILLIAPHFMFAQPDTIPAQEYIHGNNIKAIVNANGLLFNDFEQGQFLPDGANISPIKAAGLWLGGLDPGGNLKTAIQLYNEDGKQDFIPGNAAGIPGNWNQIWRVTRADIIAHLVDYRDDKVIDNPLPSIYGWPASGNPFFKEYHGFDLPEDPTHLADFYDEDYNGVYNPDKGDYPTVFNRGCEDVPLVPDEILWSSFHDYTEHTQSNSFPIRMTVSNTVFAYNCINNPILANSIILKYRLVNDAQEDIDSCFIGLFLDFGIGCAEDDFIATVPDQNIVYVYNSDDFDEDCNGEEGFGQYPPVAAIKLIRGPLNEFRQELPLSTVMPLLDDPGEIGMTMPGLDVEYYRYMTGSWRDGMYLTTGGDGYDPASTNFTKFIYPGHPLNDTAWNERNAGNSPGKRRVIASYGPFLLQPGAVNEIVVAFTFFPKGVWPFEDTAFEMYSSYASALEMFDWCFGVPFGGGCTSPIQFPPSPPQPERERVPFRLYPNPASDLLKVALDTLPYYDSFEVYDAFGRLVFEEPNSNILLKIDVHDWPQGVYYCVARIKHEIFQETFAVVRGGS